MTSNSKKCEHVEVSNNPAKMHFKEGVRIENKMVFCAKCDKEYDAVPSQVESIAKVNESIDWEKEFKTPQPDEWEKGFEDWWTDVYFRLETFEPNKPMLPPGETADEVKSFIRSTIQSAVEREREEVVRKVEGKVVDIGEGTYCNTCKQHIASGDCDCRGYNRAISDVLANLKSNLK